MRDEQEEANWIASYSEIVKLIYWVLHVALASGQTKGTVPNKAEKK